MPSSTITGGVGDGQMGAGASSRAIGRMQPSRVMLSDEGAGDDPIALRAQDECTAHLPAYRRLVGRTVCKWWCVRALLCLYVGGDDLTL